MIKTDSFIKALGEHGMVDDAVKLDNGYDIQYKGNIVSVRFDGKGGAAVYSKKLNNMVEVRSGRLDDVLHRYIMQGLFGTHSKIGSRDVQYDNVFFVPTKIIRNSVIFEDSVGRKFTVKESNPSAVMSFYNQLVDVNADDCMVLLNNFDVYERPEEAGSVKDTEMELQVLKCSFDIDDYAVSPRASCINNVGQTIVGNFLTSSADKANEMTFEEDEKKLFSSASNRKNITSSSARVRNPLALKARSVLSSSRKNVTEYIDTKYPDGLCVSAIEHVLAYEAPSIIKSANVNGSVSYKKLFSECIRDCDTVSFRLDSNKSILCSLNVPGKSVMKFRAIPDVGEIKSALQKEGYLLSELSDGLEFNSTSMVVSSLVNSCKEFVPVSEKVLNKPNVVSKVTSSEARKVLASYGIDDRNSVFNSFARIVVN